MAVMHSTPHFCTIKLQLVSSCVHFLVNCLSKSAYVECCRGAQRSDGGRPTLEPQCGSDAGESAGAGGALPLAQFASAGGGRSGARRLQRVARATAAIRRVLQRRVRSVNFFRTFTTFAFPLAGVNLINYVDPLAFIETRSPISNYVYF
jgi:hypothetical protein